jgi:hypothetical protein
MSFQYKGCLTSKAIDCSRDVNLIPEAIVELPVARQICRSTKVISKNAG